MKKDYSRQLEEFTEKLNKPIIIHSRKAEEDAVDILESSKIKNICKKCRASCCKMGGPEFTKREMQKVLNVGFKNKFRKINENHYELKSKKGICPYLSKENSCIIHKVRPNMCKCWPVTVEYKDGKKQFSLAKCPLTKFLTKKDINEMKKQARDIPSRLLKEMYEDSKLSKQDLKLIKKRFDKFEKKRLK